jgi:hypothetical protein
VLVVVIKRGTKPFVAGHKVGGTGRGVSDIIVVCENTRRKIVRLQIAIFAHPNDIVVHYNNVGCVKLRYCRNFNSIANVKGTYIDAKKGCFRNERARCFTFNHKV